MISQRSQTVNLRRHWPVFWASLTVVLVTWGVVPTQAGIFSVASVTLTTNINLTVSTSHMPVDQQSRNLFQFPQSTYGIAALNETLPAYMARNYTLAPFVPQYSKNEYSSNGIYTAPTTMYSLELQCEEAKNRTHTLPTYDYSGRATLLKGYINSTYVSDADGCSSSAPSNGNLTMGATAAGGNAIGSYIKQYTAHYIGYHYGNNADYYLSTKEKCRNTTFFAAFAKSKVCINSQSSFYWRLTCVTSYAL